MRLTSERQGRAAPILAQCSAFISPKLACGAIIISGKNNENNPITKLYTNQLTNTYSDTNIKQIDCVVYPNPNNGIFYISSIDKVDASLFDLDGKLIEHMSIEPLQEIKLDVPKGMYFLKCISNSSYNVLPVVIQ